MAPDSTNLAPNRNAFLSAIRDAPHDDAPRLIFADWLDEQGDPARAEFIRLQCEAARLPYYDPGRYHRDNRGEQLWMAHRDRWFPAFPTDSAEGRVRRGLLDWIRPYKMPFFREAPGLFDLEPLSELDLSFRDFEGCELPSCGWFGHVRKLSLMKFRDGTANTFLKSILESPCFFSLQSLNLAENTLRTSEITALIHKGARLHLHTLDLSGARMEGEPARMFFQSPSLPSLQCLFLRDIPLGLEGARLLSAAPWLGQLRSLDLSCSPFLRPVVGEGGLQLLARSGKLSGLKELRLNGNLIGPAGIEALAAAHLHPFRLSLSENVLGSGGIVPLVQSSVLQDIEELYLNNCHLGDNEVALLAQCPHLRKLTRLDLGCNRITPQGLRSLCESPHLGNLELLILSKNPLGQLAGPILAQATGLPKLLSLELWSCELGDQGVGALFRNPGPPCLNILDISGNGLSNSGALAIAQGKGFPLLSELFLLHNRLGPRGVKAILSSSALKNLRSLLVDESAKTTATRILLRKRFSSRLISPGSAHAYPL